MLPTLSRLLLSLVAIVTFCDTVCLLGGRRIIWLPQGEAVSLKRAFKIQDPSLPNSQNYDMASGNLKGSDARGLAVNGYFYSLEDDGSTIGFADDLDKLGTSDSMYVKPKYQRMEEFADPYGMKHGPKKIVGGNQELAEFGLWQPPNSEIEADYSGDYDWRNDIANEAQKFTPFKPNDGRQWDIKTEKRQNPDLEDGIWIYEVPEKENDGFNPKTHNDILWLNKQNSEWQPLRVKQSQEDTNDDNFEKP